MSLSVNGFLVERIRKEADLGFPLLGKVPQTGVVRMIDYMASLDPAAREGLIAALATRAEAQLIPSGGMWPQPEAWQTFHRVAREPGPFTGGLRYSDIRFIAQVPKLPHLGGLDAWNRGHGGLASLPRADLLPDAAACVPAGAPLLRQLVASVLTPLGYVAHHTAGGGLRYLAPGGTLVDLDVGSKLAQLRYGVAIHAGEKAAAPMTAVRFTSVESILFGMEPAWDYLTEENAARSVALLPALVDEAAVLLETFG